MVKKTQEELQAAMEEIAEVCRKHGIYLTGTDLGEGVYGEITVLSQGAVITKRRGPAGSNDSYAFSLEDIDNEPYLEPTFRENILVDAIG